MESDEHGSSDACNTSGAAFAPLLCWPITPDSPRSFAFSPIYSKTIPPAFRPRWVHPLPLNLCNDPGRRHGQRPGCDSRQLHPRIKPQKSKRVQLARAEVSLALTIPPSY